MRYLPLGLLALSACTFEPGWGTSGGGSGSSTNGPDAGGGGGSGTTPDAAVMIDAKLVDAGCPDDDQDGVCNAVDDWPCGAKPTTLPATNVQWSGNNGATDTQINNVNLDATGKLAVATKGESVNLKLSFAIDDQACPGNCIDQIEVGWSVAPGDRYQNCAWDNAVSKQNGATGNVNMNLPAPATNGVYDLRVNLGQNFSCGANGHTEWWGYAPDADPPATRTIAKLCVH